MNSNTGNYFRSLKGTPDYTVGLGYSPASGPKVGGPIMPPGNFYQYNVNDLLPKKGINFGFGFGNSYLPKQQYEGSAGYNPVAFPSLGGFRNEVGPGNTPGGQGGVNGPLYYLPAPLGYWNYFGKPKRKYSKKKKTKTKRKKSKKSKRKKSKKKKN
jgi:hypothetical protein